MAVYKKSDVAVGGLFQVPQDRYTVRIVKASKKKSQSGNEMVVLKVEIVAPEEITVGGQKYMIAGRQHNIMNCALGLSTK